MYQLYFSSAAVKDAKKIEKSFLKEKCQALLNIVARNPYQNPPPYEKLMGDLMGCFSRRLNTQHRLVYKVNEKEKAVQILRMWTHYE